MPSPAGTTTHFEALDSWRGICACLVVMFHFHGFSPIYTSALIRNSYLFVDFFFVLSGFVIAWNYSARLDSWQAVKRFLVLRWARVYPLHLFMLLCFVGWETAKLVYESTHTSGITAFSGETRAAAVLSNVFLLHSLHVHDSLTWNGPSWSISAEAWTYAIFALLLVSTGLRNWMLWVAAIAAPLLLFHLSTTGMDVTYDWGLLRCLFGFALGVACCRIYRHSPRLGSLQSAALTTGIECLVVAAIVWFVSLAGTGRWSLLAPFVFAPAVLVFAAEAGWVGRLLRLAPLRWLGKLSYSIYLTHFFFVLQLPVVVKHVLHRDLWRAMPLDNGQYVWVYGNNAWQGTFFYLAILALTLAFSTLTFRWIETPGREWARRRVQRPRAAVESSPAGARETEPVQ
jgi:peptidoglycan/LPS O-acetylase OafA/YrhL